MMMSITDPDTSGRYTKAMEERQSQKLKAFGKIRDMTAELCQNTKHLNQSAQDACMKKNKDDALLFETLESFTKDLEQKNKYLKNKHVAVSEVKSEIEQKELKKEDILHKIEQLKEEQAKRRETIEAQNKANKNRLKNLQKARDMFHEHLGLEIRVIMGQSEFSRGKKLQFVFQNINPLDLRSIYFVIMGIDAKGVYQIESSDPALDCLPNLEKQLQETNNLAAFFANIRKEFIALARH